MRSFFDFATFDGVDGDPSLGHFLFEDLNDGVELAFVVCQKSEGVILFVPVDVCFSAFEVLSYSDFMLGLRHGVVHFDVVDFADDVKRVIIRHDDFQTSS